MFVVFRWVSKFTGMSSYTLDKNYTKSTLSYGIKAHTSNILTFLNYRLDMFLVNAFLNPTAVGYYTVAVALAEKLWFLSHSASTVLFPRVASERDEVRRKEFTPLVSRNVLLIAIVGAALIFLLSKWVILLFYSEVYIFSVRPLQILLPGIIALSVSRVLANDVAGRGHPILNAYLAGVTLVTNIGLNILWIPCLGIEGAALSSTISYNVHLIGTLIVYSKLSGNSIVKIMLIQKSDIAIYRNFIVSVVRKLSLAIK
jgi:O-antigen/teichoic acid export membrane protein